MAVQKGVFLIRDKVSWFSDHTSWTRIVVTTISFLKNSAVICFFSDEFWIMTNFRTNQNESCLFICCWFFHQNNQDLFYRAKNNCDSLGFRIGNSWNALVRILNELYNAHRILQVIFTTYDSFCKLVPGQRQVHGPYFAQILHQVPLLSVSLKVRTSSFVNLFYCTSAYLQLLR